jgi:hypothetical protein
MACKQTRGTFYPLLQVASLSKEHEKFMRKYMAGRREALIKEPCSRDLSSLLLVNVVIIYIFNALGIGSRTVDFNIQRNSNVTKKTGAQTLS